MDGEWQRIGMAGGEALAKGRFEEAVLCFSEVVLLKPDHAESWYNLGYALRYCRQFDGALQSYAKALELGIDSKEGVLLNRALILADHLDDPVRAEAELREAIRINPQFSAAWLNLGMLKEDLGERAAARDAYRNLLASEPGCGRAHARLAALDEDPSATVAELEGVLASGAVSGVLDRAEVKFALANALDATGQYRMAFEKAMQANTDMARLRPPAHRYDPQAQERLVDALIAQYTRVPARAGNFAADRGLFICGMFRSGSTVAEQLLARHDQVAAGGELENIPAYVREHFLPYPQAAKVISPELRDRLRLDYVHSLDRIDAAARYVSDKRPDNFLHLGLVADLFPGSPFIHTSRDPRDIAVSILFLNFADSVSYSERLEDVAHYLGQYRRLLSHWTRVFADRLITLHYEELVADPGGALGPVYDRLGLDRDGLQTPAALTQAIRTPSAWQARQPVNTRSVGRWRHYREELEPFLELLGGD